jgi:hypothetical protein
MSERIEIDYMLNLQIGDMDYTDLRRLEMSFVKIGSIIQRVFPDSSAAKVFEQSNRLINTMRQVQQAARSAQRAIQMYKAVKLAGAAFDPILALSAGVDLASGALTVYEQTVGNY